MLSLRARRKRDRPLGMKTEAISLDRMGGGMRKAASVFPFHHPTQKPHNVDFADIFYCNVTFQFFFPSFCVGNVFGGEILNGSEKNIAVN